MMDIDEKSNKVPMEKSSGDLGAAKTIAKAKNIGSTGMGAGGNAGNIGHACSYLKKTTSGSKGIGNDCSYM